jgi:hypothetical protein
MLLDKVLYAYGGGILPVLPESDEMVMCVRAVQLCGLTE